MAQAAHHTLRRMLQNILGFLIVAVVFALGVMWIMSGAPTELLKNSPFFQSPFAYETDADTGLRLPYYQIPEYQGIPLPNEIITSDDRGMSVSDIGDALVSAEEEYDALRKTIGDVRTFGDPSPRRGDVRIVFVTASFHEASPSLEYVTLEAALDLTTPIDITGWSLQSAVTGVRAFIPQGARTFRMGTISTLSNVTLDPGTTATVTTGPSPIGVSFRENRCSGYLEQFQTFVPSLSTFACPTPAEELPATVENLQAYGDACVSFVSTLPVCSVYVETFPHDVSPQCRSFVRDALTYNGCVNRHEWRPSFAGDSWRIFLGRPSLLWRPNHDVVRLLDREGRTVDVWSY